MTGVDFSALAIVHGKYLIIDGTCLTGSSDPVSINNSVKYYLREEKQAELIKIIKLEQF